MVDCCFGCYVIWFWFGLIWCLLRFGLMTYAAGWIWVYCWIVDIMFGLSDGWCRFTGLFVWI